MNFQLDCLLGFPSLSVHHISQEGNHLNLSLNFLDEEASCPTCLHKSERINQSRPATVRDLSISGQFVSLTVDRRQFKCDRCSKLFTEVLEGFDFLHHSTLRYQEYIYERVCNSTITQVAREEQLTYDRVKLMFDLKKNPLLLETKRISIDEFSHRKGRGQFATVVGDIDNGKLLEVIDSHKQEDIIEALQSLPLEFREQVEEVSVDMWGGFPKVILEVFTNAKIVIDHFHVIQALNKELKKIFNRYRKKISKTKIKGAKYLILKNAEDLTVEEIERLEKVLECSKTLALAYALKEEFRTIYRTAQDCQEGSTLMQEWIETASVIYCGFTKTLKNHLEYICNYFINKTTSGVMEGINNKIKLIKRLAYGFTNFENLRARLLAAFA